MTLVSTLSVIDEITISNDEIGKQMQWEIQQTYLLSGIHHLGLL